MLHVTVVMMSGGYASTAIGPIEVFHAAGSLWQMVRAEEVDPRFSVSVASVDGKTVETPYAVTLLPHMAIDDIDHADIIVIPSVGLDPDTHVQEHAALLPWLRHWHGEGAYVAGACTGAAYLAAAGLLDGRLATTHWAVADTYRNLYPAADWQPERLITEDARVLCSGGVSAATDLSLYMVEKFCGHQVALECSRALLIDMPRAHQSGYSVLPLSRPHSDGAIRVIEDYIEENFARDLSIEFLADRAGMSPRTFIRRFKAATGKVPGHYAQSVRIAVAREMFEDGARSVQAVSAAVGYDDVAFFRSLFKRHTGMTPGEYRARFAGSARDNAA